MPSSSGKKSGKKVFVFKLISFLIPFLLLVLLEISLRLFQYGNNLHLFVEYPGNKEFLVLNPAASKKYFINEAIASAGNSELFKKQKDDNTTRIFVLGESTTIGYPYFHNGSFHRWLRYRLTKTFPDRRFEIINLSLTGVNSYTVSGFAKELVDYEPDAVLIYCGHNEYYGTLGVGSTSRIGGNPHLVRLVLMLRQLRITQLITNLYKKIIEYTGNNKRHEDETLMRLLVADQQIPYQSELYYRGVHQFESNMDKTLSLFNSLHIPVFISNLVCNEKDLKPFVNISTDSSRLPGFKRNYNLGMQAFERKDFTTARGYLEEADRIYRSDALCNYYLGKTAYLGGDYKLAKDYFSKARDLDGLRFRASGQINEVISRLCAKYPYSHLVDTRAAFDSCSNNGIIGNELMLEHVHPNLAGYALMSDVFYRSMKQYHLIDVNKENEIGFDRLVRDMPITTVDSLTGIYTIEKMKRSWPFSDTVMQDSIKIESREEQLAYELSFRKTKWAIAMDSLYYFYVNREDFKKARTVMEGMTLEYPEEATFYEKTATLYGKLNDFADAAFYFKKSFALSPSFQGARALFVIYLKLDKPVEAIPYLDYAIHNNEANMNLAPVKRFAEEVIRLEKMVNRDSSDLVILNQIAGKYYAMGNKEGASKYIEKVLKTDPGNKEALMLLEHIKRG